MPGLSADVRLKAFLMNDHRGGKANTRQPCDPIWPLDYAFSQCTQTHTQRSCMMERDGNDAIGRETRKQGTERNSWKTFFRIHLWIYRRETVTVLLSWHWNREVLCALTMWNSRLRTSPHETALTLRAGPSIIPLWHGICFVFSGKTMMTWKGSHDG